MGEGLLPWARSHQDLGPLSKLAYRNAALRDVSVMRLWISANDPQHPSKYLTMKRNSVLAFDVAGALEQGVEPILMDKT